MFKISVPKPCHENWDAMSAQDHGRFCSSCEKIVIDFTNMSDEEVQNFFINKKEERVCGRFSNHQIERIKIELSPTVFQQAMPVWKRFLLASLIIFSTTLFSCDVVSSESKAEMTREMTTGVIAHEIKEVNQNDTMPFFLGKIAAPSIDTTKCNVTTGTAYMPISETMGDIVVAPVKPIELPPTLPDTILEQSIKGEVNLNGIQQQILKGKVKLDTVETKKLLPPQDCSTEATSYQ